VFLLDQRNFLTLTAGETPASLASSSGPRVFTADETGVLVDSVVLVGEKSAMVIDAQFTRASANALADMVQATGRKLETVFITHHHPDHLFGLSVLLDRFPEARAVAHPSVAAAIEKSAKLAFDQVTSHAPHGVFPSRLATPAGVVDNSLNFEGERIDILDPMAGDTAIITPVHVPALDLLIAADVAYVDTHLWLDENTAPRQIDAWRESTQTLDAIRATTVIPGHRKPGSASDNSVFAFTRAYLDRWEQALGSARSADELRAQLADENDNLGFQFALSRSVQAVFPEGGGR